MYKTTILHFNLNITVFCMWRRTFWHKFTFSIR